MGRVIVTAVDVQAHTMWQKCFHTAAFQNQSVSKVTMFRMTICYKGGGK